MDTFKTSCRYDLGRYYHDYGDNHGGYYNKYLDIQIKGNKARVRIHDRIPSTAVSHWIDIQTDNTRGKYLPVGDKKIYFSDCILV